MSVGVLSAVICSHSSYNDELADLTAHLKASLDLAITSINEKEPANLELRANQVKSSDVVILLISTHFQNSLPCMEIIHYAKDLKKRLVGVNVNRSAFYRPFGALGAILISTNHGIIELRKNVDSEEERTSSLKKLTKILQDMLAQKAASNEPGTQTPSDKSGSPQESQQGRSDAIITHNDILPTLITNGNIEKEVIVSSAFPGSNEIIEIIEKSLTASNLKYLIEDSTKSTTNVATCRCLVVIMSQEYEENMFCRNVVQTARSLKIPIVPVSITRAWKPEGWLGLVTAGKLFYRILNRQQAYATLYDSTPMSELMRGIFLALAPAPSQTERETALVRALQVQIEDYKRKLHGKWPPTRKKRTYSYPTAVKVALKEPTSDVDVIPQKYVVQRVGISMLPSLFDNFGVPLRFIFDCMISYQWQYQNLVNDVFMNFRIAHLLTWFDISGGMQGNSNEAMATAIESSRVICVFLSDKYQKSPNCQLEVRYAHKIGKPFVFIKLEPDLIIEGWLRQIMDGWPVYEAASIDDFFVLKNGVMFITIILQAIRDIGIAQPDTNLERFELSEEIIELKELLEDAQDELKESSPAVFKTCTRCQKQYDEKQNNQMNCKYHSGYYLGGTIIAGSWVCCSQTDTNAFGCVPTQHISAPRAWTQDQCGTHAWIPR